MLFQGYNVIETVAVEEGCEIYLVDNDGYPQIYQPIFEYDDDGDFEVKGYGLGEKFASYDDYLMCMSESLF
jgi:hypothetical protein